MPSPLPGSSARDHVDVHVVAVLEHGAVARGVAGVVAAPAALRTGAGRPDPLVEDDVVDVETRGVGDEVRRDRPPLAVVAGVDRASEQVHGPAGRGGAGVWTRPLRRGPGGAPPRARGRGAGACRPPPPGCDGPGPRGR